MNFPALAAVAVVALSLPLAAAAQGKVRGETRSADPVFQYAIDQYQQGRVAAAYGRFVELANQGDADAARIALFMHHYGPMLYGKYWDADATDLQEWRLLAESPKGRSAPAYRPTPGQGPMPQRVEPVRGPR